MILVSAAAPENADSPMLVTLDGTEMDVNEDPAKASNPISLTPPGITTAPEQSAPFVTTLLVIV